MLPTASAAERAPFPTTSTRIARSGLWELPVAGRRARASATMDDGHGNGDGNGNSLTKLASASARGGSEVADVASVPERVRRPLVPEPLDMTTYKMIRGQQRKQTHLYDLPTPPLTSGHADTPAAAAAAAAPAATSADIETTPRGKRKFKPQLIEVCRRMKRTSAPGPAMLPVDKTDITPVGSRDDLGCPGVTNDNSQGTNHIYLERPLLKVLPQQQPVPPVNSPHSGFVESMIDLAAPVASPRPLLDTLHLNTHTRSWAEVYTPRRDPISAPSSASVTDQTEGVPSLTASFDSSNDSLALQLARTRESCDERFSGYLLALAAQTAEKQLREQALAAFPNEYSHEIVEHFYTRASGSDSSTLSRSPRPPPRRHSSGDGWAAREMRAHQQKLERMRTQAESTCSFESAPRLPHEMPDVGPAAKPSPKSGPFWNADNFSIFTRAAAAAERCDAATGRDDDLDRKARSPPMLGSEIKFRICPSPKATKFESDQPINLQITHSSTGGGLWGGYCIADSQGVSVAPSLITGPRLVHTPRPATLAIQEESDVEQPEPEVTIYAEPENVVLPRTPHSPRRPKSGIQMLAGLEERLHKEARIEREQERIRDEFDDSFVTQVFNYLSLGYPSMARDYDEEIALISTFDIDEIRSRDDVAEGFIGIVPWEEHLTQLALDTSDCDGGSKARYSYCSTDEEHGPRWRALKSYIWEWARQHPDTPVDGNSPASSRPMGNGWALGNRRDSWAI